MNVVLLGAPGSGKGTQAKPLSERYKVPHISTGDIFRQEIAKKSELGLQVQEYVSSGRLVPDELVLTIVTQRLSQPDCAKGFLLGRVPAHGRPGGRFGRLPPRGEPPVGKSSLPEAGATGSRPSVVQPPPMPQMRKGV
jgi:hypothetical protein